MDYYRNAIAYMKNHLVNPRFFVFADNKEWVKEYFTGFEYTLVDGNPGDGWGSHFDMQLMSLCKHNIISNSTYSWWGAYLNGDNGVVITPTREQYLTAEKENAGKFEDYYKKSWLTVE